MNLIENNVGIALNTFAEGKNSLRRTPELQAPRSIIDKCKFMKLKSLYKAKTLTI